MQSTQTIICEEAGCPLTSVLRAFRPNFSAAAVFAALMAIPLPAMADASQWPICGSSRRVQCVVDGDTFWHHRIKYRIADIDAPESGDRAHCQIERQLADAATHKLKELLDRGGLNLESVGTDRYGRVLVRAFTDGHDISREMINAGLAVPFGKPDRFRWCRSSQIAR